MYTHRHDGTPCYVLRCELPMDPPTDQPLEWLDFQQSAKLQSRTSPPAAMEDPALAGPVPDLGDVLSGKTAELTRRILAEVRAEVQPERDTVVFAEIRAGLADRFDSAEVDAIMDVVIRVLGALPDQP